MDSLKKGVNWIDCVGIGLFMMSSIMYFSNIFESVLQHFLIATGVDSITILWLVNVVGLLLVVVTTVLVINKMITLEHVISRKNLKKATFIFFVVIVLQALYSVYGLEFMYDKYPEEFDTYYDVGRENLFLRTSMQFLWLLKYLAFGSVLLLKRDTAMDHKIKRGNQISEIGNS